VLANTHDLIPIAAPDIGEEEEAAVLRVLRSGRLAQGPEVEALEQEFAEAAGLSHVVAVANGTLALQAALHTAGVRPGDEVLVPDFTFAATANAVIAVGAVPVFVDIDDHFLIDLDDAAAKVSEATTAVMPVHLYGLMVDMSALEAFASRHGLAIVEDAAQAHLARRGDRAAGGTGIGAFSLYATKNMTTGEGGFVTTGDEELARALRRFRNHGMVSRYEHTQWGLNLRMTDLAAAIGRVQLRKLPEATRRRRENAGYFSAHLPGFFVTPDVPDDAHHVFHQYVVRVPAETRDAVLAGFRDRHVGADVYYPTPLHHQKAFGGFARRDCPAAERAAAEVIALPVHARVGRDERERIVAAAVEIAEEMT